MVDDSPNDFENLVQALENENLTNAERLKELSKIQSQVALKILQHDGVDSVTNDGESVTFSSVEQYARVLNTIQRAMDKIKADEDMKNVYRSPKRSAVKRHVVRRY